MIAFLYKKFKRLFIIFIFFLISFSNIALAKFIRDTEIENIIYGWADPIFTAAGIPKNSIKIHLVADNNINAFVTDGKNMFINTGLIIKAGSANGLIGVIAHEAGHIAAGHIVNIKQTARELQENQFITSLLGMGMLILSSTSDSLKKDRIDIAQTVLSLGPSIATKSFFSYSRGKEYVADSLAMEYLKKVNRNPGALGIILKKLYGQELLLLERQDPFLRTHPLSRERMQIIKQKTSLSKVVDNKYDHMAYQRIKAKLEGFLEKPGKTLLNNQDNSLYSRYARSIAYYRAPMHKKSLVELDKLLSDYPKDPYFLELKGQILSENGYIKEATMMYKKALKIIPNSPLIQLSLSSLLLEDDKNIKKTKEAKVLLDKVIKKEPDNILAWHLKGVTYMRLGYKVKANLAAAEEFLRRRDYAISKNFANKVLNSTKKFSSENLRASDILKLINQIQEIS